jgi:hypothetical protein
MSRQEKHAWFNIGVLVVACLFFMLLYPRIGIHPATGAFGLLGFLGVAPFLFYPKNVKISKILDEREREIARRAKDAAFSIFWIFFISLFLLVTFLHSGDNITVPADFLPLVVLSAWMLVVLVQSIVMLVLSKKGLIHAG